MFIQLINIETSMSNHYSQMNTAINVHVAANQSKKEAGQFKTDQPFCATHSLHTSTCPLIPEVQSTINHADLK